MANVMRNLIDGLTYAVAPRLCSVCRRPLLHDEHLMCLKCLLDMPRAHITDFEFNTIHSRLTHHTPVARAVAWYFYDKSSPYARLIVDGKYSHRPRQCRTLGAMMAEEIAPTGFFAGIDAIVPVPIHWKKRLSRGYNQTEEMARGISFVTNIPVIDALHALRSHGVQSRHSAAQRATAIAGTFRATHTGSIANRHILIVDDLITSGATIAEALRALAEASPSALSVLSIALTI